MPRARPCLLAAACAVAPCLALADIPQRSGFSMYVERLFGTAFPFDGETRWQSYRTVSRLAKMLRGESAFGAEIATLTTETFTDFPLLVLTDQDGDGEADDFAYYDAGRKESTQEFGVFFSRGEEREPVWIVFNSGMIFEISEEGEMVIFWQTHQFVDRNADGRFDLYVVNGADADGDGNLRQTDTEWVFDDDHDGRFERAEIMADGEARVLEPVGGIFRFSDAGIGEMEVGAPMGALADMIARDIGAALEAAGK